MIKYILFLTSSVSAVLLSAQDTHTDGAIISNNKPLVFLDGSGIDDGTQIVRPGGNALRFKYKTNSIVFDALDDWPVKLLNSAGQTKIQLHPSGDSYFLDGKIGIGTSSPSESLSVVGRLELKHTAPFITQIANNSASSRFLRKIITSDDDVHKWSETIASNDNLLLRKGTNETWVEYDYTNSEITYSNVNIGIGTNAPTGLLHLKKNVASAIGPVLKLENDQYSNSDEAGSRILFFGNNETRNISIDGYMRNYAKADRLEFNFEEDGNITNTLALKYNGNVGIGTNSPATKLEVAGTYRQTGTEMTFNNAVKINLVRNAYYNSGWKRLNGDFAEMLQLRDGGLEFYGTGNAAAESAVTWTELFTIKSDGNVGIGNPSPSEKLDVVGDYMIFQDDSSVGSILFDTKDGGIELTDGENHMSYIDFRGMDNSTSETDFKGRILYNDGHATAYSGTKGLFFQAGGGGYGMSLTEGGNVGIGTFQPGHKLDVAGTINATQVLVNGNPVSTGTTYWNGTGGDISFSNGNVGIGTSSPGDRFEVQIGASDTGGVLLTSPDNTIATLQDSNGAGEDGILDLYSSGTINVRIAGSSGVDSYINAGNVGIGTTSPNRKLTVDAGHAATHARFVGTYTGIQGIQVERSGGDNIRLVTNYTNYGGGLESSSALRFAVNGDGINSPAMYVKTDGNVGIGTTSPTERLSVNGTIRSKEVKVEASPWPDYVFEDDYNLRSLEEIEKFIQANNHLPEVPSAKEVEENGVELGKMNALLLKKIEELTLHTIRQQKRLNEQDELNATLLERIVKLEESKN